jgi:uncharacterized protein
MENFLTARWHNLVMANYVVDPAILIPYLPAGTELDHYNGKCYVSLVGFMFERTKVFGILAYPFHTFEEINLRFYVTRKEDGVTKRGVVFINETVPHKAVAWIANVLYKEKYVAIPTKHDLLVDDDEQTIGYYWKIKNNWNHLKVSAALEKNEIEGGSKEEFIFEHYYGYTRISDRASTEYKVDHPRWQVYPVKNTMIHCDFSAMYGKSFEHLSTANPESVLLAEGSPIAVKWKRRRLIL